MLKREADQLKKLAKEQQALQQSMLDSATERSISNNEIVSENKYPFLNCPFLWGSFAVILLLIVI